MTMAPTSVVAVMAWADDELCRALTEALPTCASTATPTWLTTTLRASSGSATTSVP